MPRDKNNYKHGLSRTKAYAVWYAMIQRCTNPNNKDFKYYGARGITVNPRWKNVSNFVEDMGNPEEGLTLDRIDNNKGYEKDNCKWSTRYEQSNNKRDVEHISFMGRKQSLLSWCRELNLNYDNTHDRITRLGWDIERALNTPTKQEFER